MDSVIELRLSICVNISIMYVVLNLERELNFPKVDVLCYTERQINALNVAFNLLFVFIVGSASGIAQPHYLVFVELKGVRNLSEEQRYKVIICNFDLRTLKTPFSLTAHYIPDCFLNPTVRPLPTGGL